MGVPRRFDYFLLFFLLKVLSMSLLVFASSDTNDSRKRDFGTVDSEINSEVSDVKSQSAQKKSRGQTSPILNTSSSSMASSDTLFLEWQRDLEAATKKRFANQNDTGSDFVNLALNHIRKLTASVVTYTPELISPARLGALHNIKQNTDFYIGSIQDKNFIELLDDLDDASVGFTSEKFDTCESSLTEVSEANKPSKELIENWIDSFREYLSYGTSNPDLLKMEDITNLYKKLVSLEEHINLHFGSLRESVLYRPIEGQSLVDAFLGYAFLPKQLDIIFESPDALCLRSRIQYLLCLSASHNNLLALHYSEGFFARVGDEGDENDSENNEADQAYEIIRAKIAALTKSSLSGKSFYEGAFWRARLEEKKSYDAFTHAKIEGDLRGLYEYLMHQKDLNDKPIAELLYDCKKQNPGLAYLVKAHFEKELSKKIKAYELSVFSPNAPAYGYARIGQLCRERDKDRALENFCKAFENGFYSVLDDIVELCRPSDDQKNAFESRVQSLRHKYLNEGLNPKDYKFLATKFQNK